ncbi:MAG: PilC/PilY family type IV pilus protein [Burkholderiaceae bacterium]
MKAMVHAARFALILLADAALAQPVLQLATDPLLGTRPTHANVLLSLSIEFPAVGAAYREDSRNYDPARRYIGYFNPGLCYVYNAAAERFESAGRATNPARGDRSCSGKFSGSFMNWAAMSAMDIFRMALTGGRRVVDGTGLTVLERAWIPAQTTSTSTAPPLYPGVADFYANDQHFPRRVVQSGITGSSVAPVAPASVLPFAQARATVVSCRDEILIGNYDGTRVSCDEPGSDGRFALSEAVNRYKLRVKVCDAEDLENGRSGSFCFNFGSATEPSWKPAGEVQARAETMRFGVFAYLLDQAQTRYGGVLRHPIGYLGQRRYDSRFHDAGVNLLREWDDQGRFLANPLAAVEGRSGFINYLNNFGSVPGAEGAYKRYDPAAEMFYEAVRYLQWHRDGASAKAAGITAEMKGGFPVYTDWSGDPMVCAAQPNFIISISDANTWNDWEIPGNDRCAPADGDCANDAPRTPDEAYALDVRRQTAVAREVAVARGLSGLPAPLESAATGSGGTSSYYMAGLAQYGRGDIRPSGARAGDANAVGQQPFTTVSIDVGEPSATPIGQRQLNVAGVVGSPSAELSNYMLASSPERMVDVLRSAFARVASTTGSAGGGALTAATLTAGATGIFVPYYDASAWSGEIESYRFQIDNGTGRVSLAPRRHWSAAAGMPAPESRQLWLGKGGAGARELKWGELDASEQALFNANPADGAADGLGERRLQWLRGSRVDEGAGLPLRPRASNSVIGDIVNSEPAYVAAPASRYPLAGYEDFALAQATRRPMLYVATNAGLVHALDAATGIERFALAPQAVLTRLPALTHPGYRHFPLLDAPLVTGDAELDGRWASLLVAGFGAGVQGLFALDITAPDAFSASQLLWQFTDADDVDMGHVTGRPILAPIRVGTGLKWFVIVTSGYNNQAPDGAARSDGQGAIFFLDPAKPASAAWQLNRNYWKIAVPIADTAAKAGLAQPAAVFDIAGVVTELYAGDLQGQLWKFDLRGSTPVDWAVFHQSSGRPAPMFVAVDPAGTRQPITAAPLIAFAPGGGHLLFVGTGKMIERGDNAGPYTQTQSFYAVRDDGSHRVSRADLAERSAARASDGSLTGQITGADFSYGTASGTRRGWVLDLPDSINGEQQINSALLAFNALLFNTTIPGDDPCRAGRSTRYCLDPLTGLASPTCLSPRDASSDGFLSPPASLLVQSLDSATDTAGSSTRTTRFVLVEFATGKSVALGVGESVAVGNGQQSSRAVRRIGWRELINWRELRRP